MLEFLYQCLDYIIYPTTFYKNNINNRKNFLLYYYNAWLVKSFKKEISKNESCIKQFVIAILAVIVVRYLVNTLIYTNFASGMFESFGNPQGTCLFSHEWLWPL